MGKKLLPVHKVEFQEEDLSQARWYVMQVLYQDKYSKTLMEQVANMGLNDYILETFIPTRVYEETIVDGKGKSKKVKRKEAIWPNNYILIRMVMNSNTWYLCRNTTNAMGWLESEGKPLPISDSEVAALKEQCGLFEKIKEVAKNDFKGSVGDNIRIINHPFVGQTGQIYQIENNITVQLENGFKLELEPYQVEHFGG